MADDAVSGVDQTQPPNNAAQDSHSSKSPEPSAPPFIQYTRAELLHLSKSPLVTIPNGMPHFKEWFGEWGDPGASAAKKEAMTDALGQLSRERSRFRRDAEEGEGTRESLSSGRPTFKNALSFSQASGSAMGSMGSFRHPSSRLESDARREEREREREREGRRETENLRNLSQQFDRERRDREAAPHLPRIVSNGRDAKSRDSARDSRENAKESTRDSRRGRGDDAHDWRRGRDDDRQRSRSRQRGKGDREPANGSKREKDSWATNAEDRRGAAGASGRRRNAGGDDRPDGKTKDDRATLKNDRDKSLQEEQEPAWMGDYVPEAGSRGLLGFAGGEDGIQAWKRELKEKERAAQGLELEALEDDGLGGLDDEITHMKLAEEKAKQNLFGNTAEDDGLDEIQRFKKMMQESDRKRREEAERVARELAGKADPVPGTEETQTSNGTANAPTPTLEGPPGLSKSAADTEFAPTPPIPEAASAANGRIGGISLGASNWPASSSTTPSTTPATLSSGWMQSGASNTDSSSNSRLSPVQSRRFTQDGVPPDGAAVGTRSTSRFANFFGDKQREPSAPQFNSNSPVNPPHPSVAPTGNEPQLLDNLLARLAESQIRPQPNQVQDRAFGQRNQVMPSQPQYGNPAAQNMMNMQHAQPPLIQHQRAQLSMHQQQQQQQQLLSSLNAGMLSNNAGGAQGLGHGGPPNHIQGLNTGLLNPSLNLDIDGRFVSDNLVPGLRPRNGSVAYDEDFQVNPAAGMGRGAMQQHRPQQSFDALHRPQQQPIYAMGGNRTPSGGFRNGPSPIGGHNPNPMQRAPDLPHHLGGMANPLGGNLGGAGAGNANALQQQFGNRLGGMGNLGGMLGAGGPVNQPRFDERQRIQQGQAMHHQSGQSLSGMGGLPLEFGLLQQQQSSQRQMPRGGMPGVGGYPMQQNQSQMGPRNASGLHGGIGAQQYPAHMHNDFVVQPNQTANANDIMAMFLASQGNAGMGA